MLPPAIVKLLTARFDKKLTDSPIRELFTEGYRAHLMRAENTNHQNHHNHLLRGENTKIIIILRSTSCLATNVVFQFCRSSTSPPHFAGLDQRRTRCSRRTWENYILAKIYLTWKNYILAKIYLATSFEQNTSALKDLKTCHRDC